MSDFVYIEKPRPLFTEIISFIENVYPNPTDDKLRVTIKPELEVKELYFIDFNGKRIKPQSINRTMEKLEIDVSNIKIGIHILEIIAEEEINKVKVIIKR